MERTFVVALILIGVVSPVLIAQDNPPAVSIATWNAEWFFDNYTGDNSSDLAKKQSAPSREEWEWKLNEVARVIGQMKPTILALQEIENRRVVRRLTKKLKQDYDANYRIAYIEGWDNFTEQDVAIIYRTGLTQFAFREQTRDMFVSKKYYNLNKHLFATFEFGTKNSPERLTLLNVHLRATPEKHDIREKQCKLIREWTNELIKSGENVVVLGDFNTEELAGQISDSSDLGILTGASTASEKDDLIDLHERIHPRSRATHLANGQFDRILVSQSMIFDAPGRADLVFNRANVFKPLVVVKEPDHDHFNLFYDIPMDERDISDHYPVMAEFTFK